MAGRPAGTKCCDDCIARNSKKKCEHANLSLKRSSDEVLVNENKNKQVRRRTRRTKHGNKSNETAMTPSNNPEGFNQHFSKEPKSEPAGSSKSPLSPVQQFQFHVGSSDLKSRRLLSRMSFQTSPSKLSLKRKSELMKISRAMALKAIGLVHPHPDKVFGLLCNQEKRSFGNLTDLGSLDSPELKSVIWSYQNSKTGMQNKECFRWLLWIIL